MEEILYCYDINKSCGHIFIGQNTRITEHVHVFTVVFTGHRCWLTSLHCCKHLCKYVLQTELEECTETLSEIVARPYLRTPRSKIIQTAHLVQRKRQEFVTAIAKGLVPPDNSPTLKKKRKKFGVEVSVSKTLLVWPWSFIKLHFSVLLNYNIKKRDY